MDDDFSFQPSRVAALRRIRDAHVGNRGSTQAARLLDALHELGSVTTVEAVRFLDCPDPRARKMALVKAGHQIVMVWDRAETESGIVHKFGRYSLVRGKA